MLITDRLLATAGTYQASVPGRARSVGSVGSPFRQDLLFVCVLEQ
jgi:hypothetical protein